jgi:hypothetical protein
MIGQTQAVQLDWIFQTKYGINFIKTFWVRVQGECIRVLDHGRTSHGRTSLWMSGKKILCQE